MDIPEYKASIEFPEGIKGQEVLDAFESYAKASALGIYFGDKNEDGSINATINSKSVLYCLRLMSGDKLDQQKIHPDLTYIRIGIANNPLPSGFVEEGAEENVKNAVEHAKIGLEDRLFSSVE